MQSNELTPRTFRWYRTITDRITSAFGELTPVESLTTNDFGKFRAEMAKTLGPETLGNTINALRVVFKFAGDEELLDKPRGYGQCRTS